MEVGRMYSLEQIAERLGLQVRTLRGYVRSGRLRAARIGKQYRVTQDAFEELIGPLNERHPPVEVSSVIQVEAISKETADRVNKHLAAAAKEPLAGRSALRVDTIYDLERAQMKVIIIGSLSAAAEAFRLLGAVLDA
jgi:excisionase family DNA binding protein